MSTIRVEYLETIHSYERKVLDIDTEKWEQLHGRPFPVEDVTAGRCDAVEDDDFADYASGTGAYEESVDYQVTSHTIEEIVLSEVIA